jgi:hypothetical protein
MWCSFSGKEGSRLSSSYSHKPPNGLPPSVGVLAKYVLAYARASNLAEGRVRAWISYMITAGMLERTATTGQPPFVIKGGVALELRLRNRARATKGLDLSLLHLAGEHEIEWLPAIPLTESFGVTGPDTLPCLPLCHHIAQKLHGMTLPPRPGKRNERFRDLIDLLLMETLVIDYRNLRKTCEGVFQSRGTHPWPPPLDLPEHWIEPIDRLIRELDLPVADAHTGLARVRQFVDRILSSADMTYGNLR